MLEEDQPFRSVLTLSPPPHETPIQSMLFVTKALRGELAPLKERTFLDAAVEAIRSKV